MSHVGSILSDRDTKGLIGAADTDTDSTDTDRLQQLRLCGTRREYRKEVKLWHFASRRYE